MTLWAASELLLLRVLRKKSKTGEDTVWCSACQQLCQGGLSAACVENTPTRPHSLFRAHLPLCLCFHPSAAPVHLPQSTAVCLCMCMQADWAFAVRQVEESATFSCTLPQLALVNAAGRRLVARDVTLWRVDSLEDTPIGFAALFKTWKYV